MSPKQIDYSLYLVTDNTPAILGDRDLVAVVKAAVEGGTTIVQLRDKTSDTGDLIRIVKELHAITKPAGVPLVINDRVDVALASGVEGVHIGQDDIDYASARRILGPDAIIGVTANSLPEALDAARAGADYLGLGTVFATPTKENTKSIIGTAGVRHILSVLAEQKLDVKTVCIGGLNASNTQRVLYQTFTPTKSLNGVAIVSAIMAAQDPKTASSHLKTLIITPPAFATASKPAPLTPADLKTRLPAIIATAAARKPLNHNMTNLVVQNLCANIALATGSSPIMSSNGLEAGDLAALGGSLVINMGTATPEMRENHLMAIQAYNAVGGPVVFDPVGAGATGERREGVRRLMAGGYFDVIKGNEGEICTVSGAAGVKQHGVDSGASTLTGEERVELVKSVAERERCVVLLTGAVDYVSDGSRTFAVSNGHALLGEITGSGCALGTTIAGVLAGWREDKLLAVLAGVVMYEIAAERAALRGDVQGPGTFVPAFIDELYKIRLESVKGDGAWAQGAKVECL